jgi:ATP-dependent Clp protease ATP-binding subunit ClpB
LLKGILSVDENVTPFILKKLNVNTGMFEKALDDDLSLAETISFLIFDTTLI